MERRNLLSSERSGEGALILTVIMVKALTVPPWGHIQGYPIKSINAPILTYDSMALLMGQPYEAVVLDII
jgi:hypothetical protein